MANKLAQKTGGLFGGKRPIVHIGISPNGINGEVVVQRLDLVNRKKVASNVFYDSIRQAKTKNADAKVYFYDYKVSVSKTGKVKRAWVKNKTLSGK